MSLRLAGVTLSLTALVLSGCSSVTADGDALQEPVTAETSEEPDERESPEEADPEPIETTEAPPPGPEPESGPRETTEAPPPGPEPESEPARVPAPVIKEPVEVEAPKQEMTENAETPTVDRTAEDRYGNTPINKRGNLVKQIGQLAGIADLTQDGAITSEFTVTAIEPNFQCTSDYAEPALNGSYLAITFDVTTTPALAHSSWPEWYMGPYDLRIISADGMRENDSIGNSYSCLTAADELPRSLGPGERARGKIVLDTAYTSGYLVVDNLATGWEWAY